MYAVIQTGGKQYRVAVGDRLKVETLGAEPGEKIELNEVLMISNQGDVQIGTPLLEGQSVSAEVIGNGRGEKIKVFKMKRRQGYRRTQGHRQNFTEIEITSIAGNVPPAAKAKQQAESEQPADQAPEPAEASADDLTQISGIGPVIAKNSMIWVTRALSKSLNLMRRPSQTSNSN